MKTRLLKSWKIAMNCWIVSAIDLIDRYLHGKCEWGPLRHRWKQSNMRKFKSSNAMHGSVKFPKFSENNFWYKLCEQLTFLSGWSRANSFFNPLNFFQLLTKLPVLRFLLYVWGKWGRGLKELRFLWQIL